MQKTLLSICIAAALCSAGFAHASGAIDGATFPEQIVQEVTQVSQLNNIVQQVQQGYQSLYNQALNLQNVGQNSTQSLGPLMTQLIGAAGQASNLSYAGQNIAAQFQQQYPAWTPNMDYGQAYQNWNNTTSTNLQNELTAAGLQASNFTNETNALNQANQLSQSATGRLQAIQAGNQISTMLVQQIQELRQLILNQQQSQVAYQQGQLANNNLAQQAVQQGQATINNSSQPFLRSGSNNFSITTPLPNY